MAVEAIYGQTIACECGKTHHINPRQVIFASGALSQMPEILSGCTSGRNCALLMDERTRAVAGDEGAAILRNAGWEVTALVVPDSATGAWPICDDHTHAWLLDQTQAADIIAPVGSGVLNDLGKWTAFDLDVPYVCFATAASMNGYSSANVAAFIDGVKTLQWGRPPQVVISDPAILIDAPYELTASGLGDVLAKSVSYADWRINHFLFGDFFCERSVSLIADIEPLYLHNPTALRERKPETMEALFHGLLLTGVAMTMAETSAPASGAEHLISHTLDMMSSLDGVPHDLHGRQVGIGTVLASELYRRVHNLESPDFAPVSVEIDRSFWGALGDAVAAECAQKALRLHKTGEILSQGDAWDRFREEVTPYLRSPEQIRGCLKRAAAAYRAQDIGCSCDRLLRALLHAHEFRSRFTVLDVARLVGILPQAATEIIEEWS